MKFKKMESAGYLINHMARLCANELREKIAPFGLAPAQFMTLLELWNEDGLTQKELVDRLDVEQATMANTIARMQRDGLIERRPHPRDGRAQSIYITNKAKLLEIPATAAANDVNHILLSTLSEDEQQLFTKILQRLVISKAKGGD